MTRVEHTYSLRSSGPRDFYDVSFCDPFASVCRESQILASMLVCLSFSKPFDTLLIIFSLWESLSMHNSSNINHSVLVVIASSPSHPAASSIWILFTLRLCVSVPIMWCEVLVLLTPSFRVVCSQSCMIVFLLTPVIYAGLSWSSHFAFEIQNDVSHLTSLSACLLWIRSFSPRTKTFQDLMETWKVRSAECTHPSLRMSGAEHRFLCSLSTWWGYMSTDRCQDCLYCVMAVVWRNQCCHGVCMFYPKCPLCCSLAILSSFHWLVLQDFRLCLFLVPELFVVCTCSLVFFFVVLWWLLQYFKY